MTRILVVGCQWISDMNERDVLQVNLSQNDETTGYKCRRANFTSVWDVLTS